MPAGPFTALREGSRGDQLKGAAAEGKRVVLKALKTAKVLVQDAIAQARGSGGGPSGGGGTSVAPAGGAAAARSAEDASFRDLEGYLLGSAPLVTALYNASAAHALRAREQAQLLLDFGAALRALGQTEGGALGDSLSAVGLAAWASSTAEYEAAVCATEALVERLADYVRLARAVRETLDARARASADLADALTHVERLKALVASLAHSAAPSAAKDRYAAEAELGEAQRLAAAARVEYDAAAAGVVAEAARARAGQAADVRAMLLDFVTTQVRTELKLAAAWEKSTATTLAAVGAERGAAGGGPPASPGGIATVAF